MNRRLGEIGKKVLSISVVIRAYNEERHIEKLLLGIQAQTRRPGEVILVDSGSTDQTVSIARRHGAKIVPIEKSQFTFGRALNLGCAAASGEICVFPSAHVYPVYEDWLEKLAKPFENPGIMVSYGRQIGNECNKFSEHQIFDKWFPATSAVPQKTYFCNNANCAIRRSEWEAYKYDETLTGLEDLAWAKAAQHRGGEIAYISDATIVHVHEETWNQIFNRYRREAIAMRVIDEHARFSLYDLAKLLISNIASDCRQALREKKFRREFSSILKFRYNQLTGTYRGYNDPPEITSELRSRFYYPKTAVENVDTGPSEGALIDYDKLLAGHKAEIGNLSPSKRDRNHLVQ